MSRKICNPLILLEASTGIEPVYTDLQSAASPLRQLAIRGVRAAIDHSLSPCKATRQRNHGILPHLQPAALPTRADYGTC